MMCQINLSFAIELKLCKEVVFTGNGLRSRSILCSPARQCFSFFCKTLSSENGFFPPPTPCPYQHNIVAGSRPRSVVWVKYEDSDMVLFSLLLFSVLFLRCEVLLYFSGQYNNIIFLISKVIWWYLSVLRVTIFKSQFQPMLFPTNCGDLCTACLLKPLYRKWHMHN